VAGIRHAWHSCIGDEGYRTACAEFLDEFCGSAGFVVLVIGSEPRLDFKVFQEVPGMPRVFRRNQVNGAQDFERAP
jgi:hypothetical protein